MRLSRPRISVAFRLWLLCMVTYAFFFSGGANAITRAALSLNIVERHELTIDRFAPFTADKAAFDRATFSDKAPGLSLLAIPATYVVSRLMDRDGSGAAWVTADGKLSQRFGLVIYAATLSTVSLLAAFAVVGVYKWSFARGASRGAALLAAVTLGFATPAFGWATTFFGHAASGALLWLGFSALARAADEMRMGRGAATGLGALAGLLLGSAFVIEFPAGPAVAIIGLSAAAAALARPERWRMLARVFVPATLGLAIALLPLIIYNVLAFGGPLHLGYADVEGFPGMRTGFFGISRPDPSVAAALLVGSYRGLLPLSPILALYPFAVIAGLRARIWRHATIVSVLVFSYYLAMNAGYFYWDGGSSTGPRHLVPTLPFLSILLAPLWDAAPRLVRALILLLLAASIALSLLAASVTMVPSGHPHPFTEFLLPSLASGDLHRLLPTLLLGWNGTLSVSMLLLAWAAIAWPLRRAAPPA